jgi:FKBP-type peptidyl-prolyl cis-trans isomerase
VRRTPLVRAAAVAAIAVAAAGGLTACNGSSSGSGSSATPSPSASTNHTADVAAVDKVTVTGDAGAAPTIKLPSNPFDVTTTVVKLVQDGTGDAIADGQNVTMQYLIVGSDGKSLQTTYDKSTAPYLFTAGSQSGLPTDFDTAVKGKHVGARFLLAAPSQSGTIVAAFEVTGAKTIPARATGTPVTPPAGLPVVTLGSDGKPSIKPSSDAKPTSLVIQPLIKGDGATVASGQMVTVKYSGWLWDGTAFDSSWERGGTFQFQVGAGNVISGWDKGVVGQTVGSQLLLVVPPDEGYKDQAQGSIPANSTLVFVVDILDAQ